MAGFRNIDTLFLFSFSKFLIVLYFDSRKIEAKNYQNVGFEISTLVGERTGSVI